MAANRKKAFGFLSLPLWRSFRLHPVEWCLFLCVWFADGATANSRNQLAFTLQQAGIEAIVERHQFNLDGSPTPRLQLRAYYDRDRPFGDIFIYRGKLYGAKQPGQFMLGAIVYFLLHLFGLDYVHHYLLTSALVSFLTTSLATAAATVAVFSAVRILTNKGALFWPVTSALIYAFGTTAFPYAGIAHHDALASAFIVIAFYLRLRRATGHDTRNRLSAVCAGLLLGMAITTSLLPALMVGVVILYVLSLRQWRFTIALLIGAAVGLAPLLFFNTVCFGNPFLCANLAGGYKQNYLFLDFENLIDKLSFYAWQVTLYCPIAWIGAVGWLGYARAHARESLLFFASLVALCIPILNMESDAGCQYGPRYLLPIMPFVGIGLAGFSYARPAAVKVVATFVVAVVGAISIYINFLGALFTSMYCDLGQYALWPALTNLHSMGWKDFPLAPVLLAPFVLSAILLAYALRNCRLHTVASRVIEPESV